MLPVAKQTRLVNPGCTKDLGKGPIGQVSAANVVDQVEQKEVPGTAACVALPGGGDEDHLGFDQWMGWDFVFKRFAGTVGQQRF